MTSKKLSIKDFSKDTEQLAHVDLQDLIPLIPASSYRQAISLL